MDAVVPPPLFRPVVRVAVLATFAVAGLVFGVASAGAQEPACPLVVTEDTTLQNDLGPCPDHSEPTLVIGAAGITLDLNGHKVTASDRAILNDGHDDVTIKNGAVDGDTFGLQLLGADRNRIVDIDAHAMARRAIQLVNSDRTRIVSNRVSDFGISLSGGSDHNLIEDNRVGGGYGRIEVRDSEGNRITGNEVSTGELEGILLIASRRNTIAGNRVTSFYEHAIDLRQSPDNVLAGNVVLNAGSLNPHAGISLSDSRANWIDRNVAVRNAVGIWISSGEHNVLSRNQVVLNTLDGVRIDAAVGSSSLILNTAIGNGDDGFEIQNPGTRLIANTSNFNAGYGIRAVPGVFGIGNTASGNGNPAQCLNIRCR